MKKIIILVLVLSFVIFLGISFNSCGASGLKIPGGSDPSAAAPSTPISTMDPEQLHQEIEEAKAEAENEGPLLDASGEEIPSVTISEEYVIELEEDQGSGGF